MKIKFLIYRFNSQKKSKLKYDSFEIPYSKGMTVLDVIAYIYKNLDPTLAFRYECRQGICGTCGVMLNKRPVLSCSTQIDPTIKIQMIEPLANFPVEKDLIVNLEPVLKRYEKIKPYLDKVHKVIITKKKSSESKHSENVLNADVVMQGRRNYRKIFYRFRSDVIGQDSSLCDRSRDGLDRKAMAKKPD